MVSMTFFFEGGELKVQLYFSFCLSCFKNVHVLNDVHLKSDHQGQVAPTRIYLG